MSICDFCAYERRAGNTRSRPPFTDEHYNCWVVFIENAKQSALTFAFAKFVHMDVKYWDERLTSLLLPAALSGAPPSMILEGSMVFDCIVNDLHVAVQVLLDLGVSPDSLIYRAPLLFHAGRANAFRTFKCLLQNGADPNGAEGKSLRPIFGVNSMSAVRELVSHGVNLNLTDMNPMEESSFREMSVQTRAEILFSGGKLHLSLSGCEVIQAAILAKKLAWLRLQDLALVFIDVPVYTLIEICMRLPFWVVIEEADYKKVVTLFQSARDIRT